MTASDSSSEYPFQNDSKAQTRRPYIAELGSHVQRMREELAEGNAALIVRVSTKRQLKESKGSLDFQERQIRYLEPYEVSPSAVERYVSAESAQGEDDRPDFEKLISRIESGLVRVVIAAFADRMSRNWPQFQQLGDALAKVKGIIILEGEPFDFASSRGRHEFRNAASLAVYQSEQRVQRNLVTQCSKARKLALAYTQPSGLCWASLEDPVYVRALREQNMLQAIGRAPEGHLTNVTRLGLRYLQLPYPDEQVYKAMVLRRDVLLQTRDVRAVVDMIHSDSAWPHKHHWPVRKSGNLFSLTSPPIWKDLRSYRATTHSGQLRNVIARWYLSPSLYGVYEWHLADDVELDEHLRSFGASVEVQNASPDSLFRPEQRVLVREILGKRDRHIWEVSAEVAKPKVEPKRADAAWRSLGKEAVLPEIRCSVMWREDEECHGKLVPHARAERVRLAYVAPQCRARHRIIASLSEEAEDLIVETVLKEVSPATFSEAVRRIDLNQSVEQERLTATSNEIRGLDQHLAFLRRELRKAQEGRTAGYAKQLLLTLRESGERYEELVRLQAEAEAGLAVEKKLTSRDRESIQQLASRLPELWARCDALPGARSELMRALIKRVHVRRIGTRMDYVEIEFPSGVRVQRVVCVAPVLLADTWRRWCRERLRTQLTGPRLLRPTQADMAEAERAADELNSLVRRRSSTQRWSGMDVRAAAILALYASGDSPMEGAAAESLATLADRTKIPIHDLRVHARLGHLGEPTFFGGEIRYQTTEAALCRWFLEYARQRVSLAMGWPKEDTIALSEAAHMYGVSRRILALYVRHQRLTVPDAWRRPWLRASAFAATVPPTLEQAVYALKMEGVEPADFLPVADAAREIIRLTGKHPGQGWHNNGQRKGYVLKVRARRAGALHECAAYVYLPRVVRRSKQAALAVRWINGLAPSLAAWSPRRRTHLWRPDCATWVST